MTMLLTVGSLLLAVIIGNAAVAKLHSFSGFVDYLSSLFSSYARSIAALVIGIEAVLSVSLIIATLTHRGLQVVLIATGCFFVAATIFISLQLVLLDSTRCECWGAGRKRAPKREGAIESMLRPAWYGLRNGILLSSTWLLLDLLKNGQIQTNVTSAALIFTIWPMIIAVGLVRSIVVRRRLLKLEEHPRKRELAPHLAPLVALSWYMDNQVSTGDLWVLTNGPTARSLD